GDMLGVWIEPVIAQVMMTLFFAAMSFLRPPLSIPRYQGRHPRGSNRPRLPRVALGARAGVPNRGKDSRKNSLNLPQAPCDYRSSPAKHGPHANPRRKTPL